MQLIGEVVFHKKFGEGEILDKLDRIIIIHFPAGKKKFYFPDAFEKHLVLKSERKQRQVDKLVVDLVSEREACENARMEEQRRQARIKDLKVTLNSQAAFGFVNNSKEEVFTSWELTTGTYLSGSLKGTPRIPKKMQLNSACLLTECPRELTEKERKILRDLQEKITVPERRKLINEFYQYYLRVNKLEQEETERMASEIEK